MSSTDSQRVVLLNRVLSTFSSRAPQEHKPPLHSGLELFELLDARRKKGWAIEYIGALDSEDETERLKHGAGLNSIRLSQLRFEPRNGFNYAVMLIEYIDQAVRSFPVVHTETFRGREIEGDEQERGAASAHVVVRLPPEDGYDDLNYRCAFEFVSPINRLLVEKFINRQLRRESDAGEWTFGVMVTPKGKKAPIERVYRYTPKIRLVADVGRKLGGAVGKDITQMVFTKRSERQAIGQATAVIHQDVYADVEFRIAAKQAPVEPRDRVAWFSGVREYYETLGYETKLYYRHAGGRTLSGELHHDLANAADLMMCQREIVTLSELPKRWRQDICGEIVTALSDLLDKDELWQRAT